MTKYNLSVPDALWHLWKGTIHRDATLDEGIVSVLAGSTVENHQDLTEEQAEALETIAEYYGKPSLRESQRRELNEALETLEETVPLE